MNYLDNQVSLAGLKADPKDIGSLINIPFPQTLRAMQSFLSSLNLYSRFIEDFAIYALVLYDLREADFSKIRRVNGSNGPKPEVEKDRDPGIKVDNEGRSHWEKATIAFIMLKAKIARTPVLKHFDPERSAVIVVYASKW